MTTITTTPNYGLSTVSLPASMTTARAAASSALSNPSFQDSPFANMSTKEFDVTAYTLNNTQRSCLRDGALPVALAMNDTCLLGFHCPKSSEHEPPQYCHPTETCAVMRSSRKTCQPQGSLEPKICANGFYCPPGGKQEIPCPKGTFCPSGSFRPMNCTYAAICPEMSARQIVTVPIYLTVVIDLAIVVGLVIAYLVRRRGVDRTNMPTAPVPDGRSQTALLETPGETRSPSLSGSDSNDSASGSTSTHPRRANGRVDHYDGYADDDKVSTSHDDDVDNDLQNTPNLQRFIRSMSRTVETSSIGLSFEFENLSFCTKAGNAILADVTGTIPRGSCWGIMGGSGAGKSTFVNVLMGKIHASKGTIKINGHQQDMTKYKKLIGYVPQDDIVLPELTVRENILHSARCRLPRKWGDRQIREHVDALIASLQLTHVQHSRVGDVTRPVISGGQRKRVNIGMELAAAPMAIFLDEPTSGLDATSACSMMKLLRAISRLGVTTIAIVHQPRERIFQGFDQVLLLAEGRSVYSGPTEAVQTYFEGLGYAFPQKANPADVLIDIITGDGAEYCTSMTHGSKAEVAPLVEAWKAGSQCETAKKSPLSLTSPQSNTSRRISNQSLSSTAEQDEALRRTMRLRGASWIAQMYYCWKRATTQQLRNRTSFIFEIGVGGIAGVVIGLSAFASKGHLFQGVYREPFTILSSAIDYVSTPQIGLLGAMAIGLAASAPGSWVFGEEKLMYWRETASGHSRSAYYVGKLLSTIFRIALSSWHFTLFLGVLATPLISFPQMYAANLMYFWCIYGLASIVSMLVKREDGPLLAVLASLVIGVLGGVSPPLSKVKDWHMEWFWRMSPGVWYTEAFFSQNVLPMSYLYRTDIAAKATGYTLGQYALDIGMLFVIGLAYRIVAYLGLILMHRDKQR